MTTPQRPADAGVDAPPFVASHAEGLRDFWKVYDASYDRILEATGQLTAGHPEFGPLLRGMPPGQQAAQSQKARERLRRALVEGQWEQYVADLRAQGALYARMGVSFSGWSDIVRSVKRVVVPRLVEAFVHEPERLSRAITAMTELVDFVMVTIAEPYLQAREHHESEAAERFLDSIVENLPLMVFVKEGKELRFERLNRAGEELLGLRRGDLVGKNDFDFFPREQAEFFQARDRETLAGKAVVDIPEEPIQTPRGERWLHTRKVPVLDANGLPAYLLGISEDITESRAAAAAVRRAKESAEAANRELEAFSYSVAHDLRAPLRGIHGFSQALAEDCGDALGPEAKDHLGRIQAGAERMGQLIDAMLSMARLARTELRSQPVNLSDMATSVVEHLRAAHPERSVELVCPPGLTARGDPVLLRVLLENLLGNAWKFTAGRPSARIEIGSETSRGETSYFVRDDGAGFDMTYAEKLFAPFQRLHSTREFAGTGVGLATVERVVRRHGGRVWAEGAVGEGAVFHFTLAGPPADGGG
ncbi:MAG TPA: ATP-binding protein [Polyangiaceae bacterium]|jgi:hypothetical protein